MDLSNITVNKQSSIRIAGTKVIYFDPFEIEGNSNDADYIFLTHEHYDHFDPESVNKIKNDKTILVAPASMRKTVAAKTNMDEKSCIFLNPFDNVDSDTINILAVPAYNNLKPFHPKFNKWLGYVVTMDAVKYYIAGDTDPNKDNKNVDCDVALIPVGGMFTMNVKEAAAFALELKPKAVIPTHYGKMVGKVTDGADFKSLIEEGNKDIMVKLCLCEG